MKSFVCMKYVPDTSEADLKLDETGMGVDTSRLSFDINEADNYAVEEAVQIKENHGGEVSVLSIGPQDSEVTIRMALAKGGDNAVRIEDSRINRFDPLAIAKVLASAVKDKEFDLILTGCMASDDGHMSVGVAMAEELGVSHASMVKQVEVLDGKVKVHRELEGGLMEVVELELPAVLTIQTGINEPRYAPIKGIRKAQKKELNVVSLDDLGLPAEQVDENASKIKLKDFYIPVVEAKAEFIEGEEPEEKAEKLAEIMQKGGLV